MSEKRYRSGECPQVGDVVRVVRDIPDYKFGDVVNVTSINMPYEHNLFVRVNGCATGDYPHNFDLVHRLVDVSTIDGSGVFHLPPTEQPSDKDAHGMCKDVKDANGGEAINVPAALAEIERLRKQNDDWITHNYHQDCRIEALTAERDAWARTVAWYKSQSLTRDDLQVQVKRVVDQCEAIIGDKAQTIPFGMAVSETIATLTKRAELAEAGAANFHIDIAKALFGDDWRNTSLHSILTEIELLHKRDEAYEKLKDDLHALALAAPAAEVQG